MSGRGHHLPTIAPARGCAIRCAGTDGVRYPPLSMSDPLIPEETRPLSAIPSVGTRVAAFVAILVAGLAGGLIGFALVDLQCEGDCGVPLGLGLLAGAVSAAVGMAVVAVLVMRAIGEWREIEDRTNAGHAPR